MRDWNEIERILGYEILPWQRAILDQIDAGRPLFLARGWRGGYRSISRAARLARVCDAIDDLERHVGVTGHVGTDARCIVVSESDYAVMHDYAKSQLTSLRPVDIRTVTGIPVVTAPDWTCNEFTVAWLRLRAHVERAVPTSPAPLDAAMRRHCAGCGDPIGEHDFTQQIDGHLVHEGCKPGAHGAAHA